MNVSSWRVAMVVLLGALPVAAGPARAGAYVDPVTDAPPTQGRGATAWQPFVSVTPLYQGSADLDNGGDFTVGGAVVRGGASYDFGGGTRAGVTLNYDYLDYSFSGARSWGGSSPWGVVQRYGVSLPVSFAVGDGWRLAVAPSVDWFRENGASTGDSLVWGALFSGTRRFADGNLIGLGIGVYDGIEKTSVYPFLLVDWRLGERWRLINPLASGPTGPAGIELDYQFDGGWTAGVGVSYRAMRFRLSDDGPTPDGVGEERGVPIFLRVSRQFTDQLALHLYGGIVVAGQLRVENSSGNLLRKDDFDPAPLFGATFIGRF
ncbi:MAG: hypothetical protein FAZ92_01624 [Accumulibacter sp.]|nr:MAG: hypothetical protein FAZ92_01624 [Accumulibacter sp.]